jgi:hypothetical protein
LTVNVCPAIDSVPVRAGPLFAATLKDTVPLPLPDVPPVIASQSALFDVAVQAQPAAAVTVTDPAPPGVSTFAAIGAIVNEHGAAWFTVNV